MMRAFVYTDLNERLKTKLRDELKGEIELTFHSGNAAQSRILLEKCDILMGNPPAQWLYHGLSQLKFWQLDSAGFHQYAELTTSAIVANMGDFFSLKCAETIVGGILAFYRGLPSLIRLQQSKTWVGRPLRYSMDLLSEKKVIILGAGSIAQSIKKILTGFDCTIKLSARSNPAADLHGMEELIKNLPWADVVINTLPGNADKYVSEKFFAALKEGALYASVGRGNTTDEKALLTALTSGKLVAAVLDVTEEEPLPATHPLWSFENVMLTQHTGGGHKFEDEGKVNQFLNNVTKFVRGQRVDNQINLQQGY